MKFWIKVRLTYFSLSIRKEKEGLYKTTNFYCQEFLLSKKKKYVLIMYTNTRGLFSGGVSVYKLTRWTR